MDSLVSITAELMAIQYKYSFEGRFIGRSCP